MSQIVNTRDLILQSSAKRTVYSAVNKVLLLDADAPVFIEQQDHSYVPAEIHLTANPLNIAGVVTFTVSDGVAVTQVGNVATIKASDMLVDRVTVTATIVEGGITYSRSKIISKVIDGIAAIKSEQIIRQGADFALASQIDTVSAEVGDNKALIQNEVTTRANSYSALAQRIEQISVSSGDSSAAIQNEAKTRADADGALATRIDQVGTYSGENRALITGESITRTNQYGALAQQYNTLSTTVGQNTATVQQFATSIDGLKASYGIRIDNQGRTIGYQLNSGAGGYGTFVIAADSFSIVQPGTFDYKLFWDGARLIVRGDIYADNFFGNVVSTGNIKLNAVSGQISQINTELISAFQYDIKDMNVIVVQCTGAPITLFFGCLFSGNTVSGLGSSGDAARLLLTRDGLPYPMFDYGIGMGSMPLFFSFVDNPGPGVFVYRWRIKGPDNDPTFVGRAYQRTLTALELKR